MAGFATYLSRIFDIADSGAAAETSALGVVDITKSMTLTWNINKDSGTAGVGIVALTPTAGSAQTFTSVAAAWIIIKFGLVTQKGGILVKADGTTFANADLPSAVALYANCLAFCSDGLYICKADGSSWAVAGVYALT